MAGVPMVEILTPPTPCRASVMLESGAYGGDIWLVCDLERGHPASPYPADMHHDPEHQLIWHDESEW